MALSERGDGSVTEALGRGREHLRLGRHADAWAEALMLVWRHPELPAACDLFVRAAGCSERPEEAGEVVRSLAPRLDPAACCRMQVTLALQAGDIATARACASQFTALEGSGPLHYELAIAIALRAEDLSAALALMVEREQRLRRGPLAWLIARWDILGRLGHHEDAERQIAEVEAVLPRERTEERQLLRLLRARTLHHRLRFDESLAHGLAVVAEFDPGLRDTPPFAHVVSAPAPAPAARPWTRRRLELVIADLERFVLTGALPVVLCAGTALGLVRDGDFLPYDSDLDMAALPPATSRAVAEALVSTGHFRVVRKAMDTGEFRSICHIHTGMIVDLSEYRQSADTFVSTWRHSAGTVLREAVVPAFSVRLVSHPRLRRWVPLPDDPAAYLRATYGRWEEPDPSFDTPVSSPCITGFTDFLRSLGVFRLADALRTGRAGRVRHLAGRLCAQNIAPALMERLADATIPLP